MRLHLRMKAKRLEKRRRAMGPAWLRGLLFCLLSLLAGGAVTAAVEAVRAGSPEEMLAWAVKYPATFLLSALLYASLAALAGALLGRLWLGGILASFVGLGLCLADYFKMTINGAPLAWEDIGLAGQAGHVAGLASDLTPPELFWQALLIALACVAVLAALDPLTRLSGGGWWIRLAGAAAACLVCFSGLWTGVLGDCFRVDVVTALDPSASHNTYGLAVSLWRGRFLREKEPPAGYGKVLMDKLLDRVDELAPSTASSEVKPNVIVILSESFFDVTRLPGVTYSADPTANFHALQKEGLSGQFFSHYLGYGTGYIEIAMQMGLCGPDLGARTNLCFMDSGTYELLDSLAEQYTNAGGYTAEMLHAFDNSLYNRTVTYPLMGYDRSLFSEDVQKLGINEGVYGGYYMRDAYLFEGVLRELDRINEAGDSAFLYAITMENHQPYDLQKFGGRCQVEVRASQLDRDEVDILKVGVEGIIREDQALGKLTEALRERPEPTIVAFFGDHRPTLPMPDGQTVYTKLGVTPGKDTSQWTSEQLAEVYSTDYLIWANDAALLGDAAGTEEPSGVLRFGPQLLEVTGQTVSRWWALQKRVPQLAWSEIAFVYGDGSLYHRREDAPLTEEDQELFYLRDCIVYDAIYGSQYITDAMNQSPQIGWGRLG